MARIVISTNMTLDGVVQDPDGKEGSGPGGWFHESGGSDLEAWAEFETDEALAASALLLGRRSEEWFAARWPARTGAWADRLNRLPKYVVSSSLDEARWTNATVLRGDAVEQISRLRSTVDGEILVYASFHLVRTLMRHALADELRLVVFPIIVGAGERLFDDIVIARRVRLNQSRRLGDGLIFCSYEILRDA